MSRALAVIPTYIREEKELEITVKCVETLRKTSDIEICIVDDCSPLAGAQESLSDLEPEVFIAKDENEGFAKTINKGLKRALEEERNAVLVNADIEFRWDGWLEAMEANPADVVGALLLYPNHLVQHAGIFFSVINRSFGHIYHMAPSTLELVKKERKCPVTAALQLIKYETLRDVGLYDENFRLGWEDVAYCHDVFISERTCAYEPSAVAIHHESLFRGRNATGKIKRWQDESFAYLHKKYAGHDFSAYCPTLLIDEEIR